MDRNTASETYLQLPVAAVGRMDIGRLVREVDSIDAFLRQSEIREPGTPTKMPKTSKLMDDLILANKLNLLHEADRTRLVAFLKSVYKEAPILHMSFSADPSPHFIQRLMAYVREQIHPLALVQVGLQPTIGAGCVLRTTNKYFDMSLRSRFIESRPLLAIALKGAGSDKAAPVTVPSPALEVTPAASTGPVPPTPAPSPAVSAAPTEVTK